MDPMGFGMWSRIMDIMVIVGPPMTWSCGTPFQMALKNGGLLITDPWDDPPSRNHLGGLKRCSKSSEFADN